MALVAIVGAGFMGTATAWPLTDNGHTVRVQRLPVDVDGRKFWGYPESMWPMFERNLSPEQADLMSCLSVNHGSVFPNMSFIENFKTLVAGCPPEVAGGGPARLAQSSLKTRV